MNNEKTVYNLLGKSGLKVFPLCLGAMAFGEEKNAKAIFGCSTSFEESEKIVLAYIKAGGNFIDTACNYQMGESEERIGKIIKKNKINREKLIIATKYTSPMGYDDPNYCGNSRKNMIRCVNESLKRLQTNYIDILYVHYWDWSTDPDEVLYSLDALLKTEKVMNIAISDAPGWIITYLSCHAKFKNLPIFCAFQGQYSLLNRSLEQEIEPVCKKFKLGIVPFGAIGGGKLTGKYTRENVSKQEKPKGTKRNQMVPFTEDEFKVIDVVKKIAEKRKVSCSQIAINWVLSKSQIASVLIGCRTLNHLEDNLKSLKFKLSEQEIQELDEVSKNCPNIIFPHGFIGHHPSENAFSNMFAQYTISKKF